MTTEKLYLVSTSDGKIDGDQFRTRTDSTEFGKCWGIDDDGTTKLISPASFVVDKTQYTGKTRDEIAALVGNKCATHFVDVAFVAGDSPDHTADARYTLDVTKSTNGTYTMMVAYNYTTQSLYICSYNSSWGSWIGGNQFLTEVRDKSNMTRGGLYNMVTTVPSTTYGSKIQFTAAESPDGTTDSYFFVTVNRKSTFYGGMTAYDPAKGILYMSYYENGSWKAWTHCIASTGDSMTGNLAFSNGKGILSSDTSNASNVVVAGGNTSTDGATVTVNGKSATNAGVVSVKASDGTNTKELLVKPDGTITWDGKSVTTGIYVADSVTGATRSSLFSSVATVPSMSYCISVQFTAAESPDGTTTTTYFVTVNRESSSVCDIVAYDSATGTMYMSRYSSDAWSTWKTSEGLPISGGTLTGDLKMSAGTVIKSADTTDKSAITIYGGSDADGGATVTINAKDEPSAGGYVTVKASNGVNTRSLVVNPISMTYDNKNVLLDGDAVAHYDMGASGKTREELFALTTDAVKVVIVTNVGFTEAESPNSSETGIWTVIISKIGSSTSGSYVGSMMAISNNITDYVAVSRRISPSSAGDNPWQSWANIPMGDFLPLAGGNMTGNIGFADDKGILSSDTTNKSSVIIGGGSTYGNGANIRLYGGSAEGTNVAGKFEIRTSVGDEDYSSLVGTFDPCTLKWCGAELLTAYNGVQMYSDALTGQLRSDLKTIVDDNSVDDCIFVFRAVNFTASDSPDGKANTTFIVSIWTQDDEEFNTTYYVCAEDLKTRAKYISSVAEPYTTWSSWDASAYLPLAGGTMTGAIAMGSNRITGLPTPLSDTDACTRAYADNKLPLAGGTMTGKITSEVIDFIFRDGDSSAIAIYGGSSTSTGASVAIRGMGNGGSVSLKTRTSAGVAGGELSVKPEVIYWTGVGANINSSVIIHSTNLSDQTRETIRTIITDTYNKNNCLYIFPRVKFTEAESPNGKSTSVFALAVFAYTSTLLYINALQAYGFTEAKCYYDGSGWTDWTRTGGSPVDKSSTVTKASGASGTITLYAIGNMRTLTFESVCSTYTGYISFCTLPSEDRPVTDYAYGVVCSASNVSHAVTIRKSDGVVKFYGYNTADEVVYGSITYMVA